MRTCVICGVSIEHKCHRAKVCSDPCRSDARKRTITRFKLAHKERLDCYHREYREKNKNRQAAAGRAWYLKNRDTVLARQRAYAASHPDVVRGHKKAWRERNQDQLREKARLRAADNRGKLKLLKEIETKGLETLL